MKERSWVFSLCIHEKRNKGDEREKEKKVRKRRKTSCLMSEHFFDFILFLLPIPLIASRSEETRAVNT